MKLFQVFWSRFSDKTYVKVIPIPENSGWLVRVIFDGDVIYLSSYSPESFSWQTENMIMKHCVFDKPIEEVLAQKWAKHHIKIRREEKESEAENLKRKKNIRKVL